MKIMLIAAAMYLLIPSTSYAFNFASAWPFMEEVWTEHETSEQLMESLWNDVVAEPCDLGTHSGALTAVESSQGKLLANSFRGLSKLVLKKKNITSEGYNKLVSEYLTEVTNISKTFLTSVCKASSTQDIERALTTAKAGIYKAEVDAFMKIPGVTGEVKSGGQDPLGLVINLSLGWQTSHMNRIFTDGFESTAGVMRSQM